MPKIYKRKSLIKTSLSKLLGLVFLISLLVTGIVAIKSPQVFSPSARMTEGSCTTNANCPSNFKCDAGLCVAIVGSSNQDPLSSNNDSKKNKNSDLPPCYPDPSRSPAQPLDCVEGNLLVGNNTYKCRDSNNYSLSCCSYGWKIVENTCVPMSNDDNLPSCGSQNRHCSTNQIPGTNLCWSDQGHMAQYCCQFDLDSNGNCSPPAKWWHRFFSREGNF